ncbi:MAG: ATP phosphoribosyltransferase [Actinobacteria bacterium]|nr:ATP phosphoribosyltransferase [Actinomycetota bacterium]
MKQILKIAVPKGYLLESTIKLLNKAGYDVSCFSKDSRQLFLQSETNGIKYIITRPMDVPVYVESGACDLGFAGKDVLLETESNVFELMDTKDGYCRIIIAVKNGCQENVKNRYEHFGTIKVATKYPNITRKYFEKKGMQVEIIKLYGSVELAPLLGIADEILDITATGKTLTENNLVEMENVAKSTTRLIANEVSYRIKNEIIEKFINNLKKAVN